MKIRRLALYIVLGLTASMVAMTGVTFAWLSGATTEVNVENLRGGVISQYFHDGNGSIETPFSITRPVHLYNLCQLYEKLDGFAEENYNFRLGADIDGTGALKFYDYDDNGKLVRDSYVTSLNMSAYDSLEPIGSEDRPFGGEFDGSSLTIDNLTVSGEGKSDIGFFGYVTEDAEIRDLYLDNLAIDTTGAVAGAHDAHDTNAYVGYVAGHIDNARSFTNTYVNNCRISGQSVLTKNDWGYFGKCENAAEIEDFIMRANGESAGWGGSVNMQKMYDRLYDIAGRATANSSYPFEKDIITRPNGDTFERNAKTGTVYTYNDREEGSFVFGRYDSQRGPLSDYMYLNGGTRYHQYRQSETTATGFTVRSNNRYLGISDAGAISDIATGWFMESNKLAAFVNGVKYYLTHNATLATSTSDTWTKSGNTLYYTSGMLFWQQTHYLYYNNGWTTSTSSHTLTFSSITTVTGVTEASSGADYMDYSGDNVTYFPLMTNTDSYDVARKNTGYVIGGSEYRNTGQNSPYPNKTGDIRVSKYSTSDINNSYSGGNLASVYTIGQNLRTTAINEDDYSKYAESKSAFLESITGGNIYGLHFMSANIDISHLVTADYTLINGEEKTNYQMPASSIDFNVAERGFINFFAGTYFDGNDSFFSLHHTERDANGAITAIKEISEIYGSSDNKKDYIYKYSDDSYSISLTSDYSLLFSTSQIKKTSNITSNAVYYFEIPVNAGEFALGSVDGGTGAYLMYLDIATNGGTDQHANVDTFGSVEYRSMPDIADNSIVLITYEQQASQATNIAVAYIESDKRYNITYNGSLTTITITVLSEDYDVYFNGNLLTGRIKSHILS